MSDTQFDQVENIGTRLKTQNWMVLFDATGNNDVWVDNKQIRQTINIDHKTNIYPTSVIKISLSPFDDTAHVRQWNYDESCIYNTYE